MATLKTKVRKAKTADGSTKTAAANEDSGHEEALPRPEIPEPTSTRYPDYLMPFVGSQEEQDERFADAVEAFLVNYGYNTARAYRADLEDIYLWARDRELDFFALTDKELRQYWALLRRRKYSEGTVRRRATAYRGIRASVAEGSVRGRL